MCICIYIYIYIMVPVFSALGLLLEWEDTILVTPNNAEAGYRQGFGTVTFCEDECAITCIFAPSFICILNRN